MATSLRQIGKYIQTDRRRKHNKIYKDKQEVKYMYFMFYNSLHKICLQQEANICCYRYSPYCTKCAQNYGQNSLATLRAKGLSKVFVWLNQRGGYLSWKCILLPEFYVSKWSRCVLRYTISQCPLIWLPRHLKIWTALTG